MTTDYHQSYLGHKELNTTMTYAHVHDKTVADEYFRVMEEVEGPQFDPETEQIHDLIDQLQAGNLTDEQQALIDALRQTLDSS